MCCVACGKRVLFSPSNSIRMLVSGLGLASGGVNRAIAVQRDREQKSNLACCAFDDLAEPRSFTGLQRK